MNLRRNRLHYASDSRATSPGCPRRPRESRYLFIVQLHTDLDHHTALYLASGAAGNAAIVDLPIAVRSIGLQLSGRLLHLLVITRRPSLQRMKEPSNITIRLIRKHRQKALFVIKAPRATRYDEMRSRRIDARAVADENTAGLACLCNTNWDTYKEDEWQTRMSLLAPAIPVLSPTPLDER